MVDGAESKEAQDAAWWAAWRQRDFSWPGLAREEFAGWSVRDGLLVETESRRVYGAPEAAAREGEADPAGESRPATLQDYWRADTATGRLRGDAELIAAGELLFRPSPLVGEGGPQGRMRGAGKASEAGANTPHPARTASSPPSPTGEEGAYPPETYHACHLPLAYADGAPTAKANWAADALDRFVHPRLLAAGETQFEGKFYDRKLIGPDRRAQLQGGVWLRAAAHPQGKAHPLSLSYQRAYFSRGASFQSANFAGDANFFGASFAGYADFKSASFAANADFRRASFAKDTVFHGASFAANADFRRASFAKDTVFLGASFAGDANFESASFAEDTMFFGARFAGNANFRRARFAAHAYFQIASFAGDANFYGGKTEQRADFHQAQFMGVAHFGIFQFHGLVYFDRAQFGGDMDFTAAVFHENASFEAITWPKAARDWHAAFDQARFQGPAVFTGAGFQALAAFDGAVLERTLAFPEAAKEAEANRVFLAELNAARVQAPRQDAEAWAEKELKRRKQAKKAGKEDENTAAPVTKAERKAHAKAQRELRLKQLERGCRVLKQAMEKASNHTRLQQFYRFELIARRAQTETPLWEKATSRIFAYASDYGASLARPFVALFVLWLVFAGVFYAFDGALAGDLISRQQVGAPIDPKAWEALMFAWVNIFRPLSALSAENIAAGDGSLAARLLFDHGGGVGMATRAIATVLSLFAVALAFLFGLAVRRRFQIT